MQTSCLYKLTKALQRLFRSFDLKITSTSCTDDAIVKVPSFQKVTFFLQYEIFHRDAIHLNFCLFEDVSDCVITVEHASNDFLQSHSSFLLGNNMKTNTISS